jgi:hypothetical protein
MVAMSMKSYDSDRIVLGKDLSKCFDDLKESLGRTMIETIVEEIEVMYGILLIGRFSYKLSEIEDALRKLLGDSACEMMMESLVEILEKK